MISSCFMSLILVSLYVRFLKFFHCNCFCMCIFLIILLATRLFYIIIIIIIIVVVVVVVVNVVIIFIICGTAGTLFTIHCSRNKNATFRKLKFI